MRVAIFTFLLCLISIFTLKAQTPKPYLVKGSVIDSASNTKLINGVVCVLNAKDSIMRKFTRVADNGSFNISGLSKGSFILLVSYPGYADYTEKFVLDSVTTERSFGKINLLLKSKILQDVIIKGTAAAIKIKGDTTEFNAAAFKIQPNAKVEDLLKQLPGITVDKDGKITAQGQTVPKVLVDGEEFFGDDPTLVTKNIRADMVDKVQLYDKKSDQAAFTGIDDGQKTKTINIKLKEDKKNGYFGKAEAAQGTDKYYSDQLMFNKFWGKKKFSGYGILSNTGKIGLGWEDNSKYGNSGNVELMDGGGIMITSSGGNDDLDSFSGQYNGHGIPTARTGGLHYDSKSKNDKVSVNTNYKIGSLDVKGNENTLTQNNLNGSHINSNSNQDYNNSIMRQKADITYQKKLDTATNLKIMVDGTIKNTKTRNNYITESSRTDTLLNSNKRSLNNNVDQQLFNASALYTKKLKKVGRTLSVNLSENYSKSDAKGYLNSAINFYNATTGAIDSSQHTDQYKTNNTVTSSFNTSATYTEPLSKKFTLSFTYNFGLSNNSADRKSFNASAPDVYNVLDKTYSNYYKYNQLSNQGGAVFNYKSGKTTFNFGTRAANVNYSQTDEYTGLKMTRNFINWNPSAFYRYAFSQFKSFSFNYYGNTTQPTIDQIQPIRVNTDPLNITLGNPDLRPSFNNRLSAYFNSYKVLTEQSIWIYATYSFATNPIVYNTTTDKLTGKSTLQAVNITNRDPHGFNLNVDLNRKIKKVGFNVGLDMSANGNVSYNYVNNVLNTTKSYNYSGNLSISKYVQKKIDFRIYAGPNYTVSGSSLQPDINNNGSGFSSGGNFNIYLPGKFQLWSDGDYTYRGKTQSFDQTFSAFILNSGISKTFLKQDNLKLTVSGNDLLNQNRGFTRNASANLITQNTYTTIRRYFMFSISWDFSKMGGGMPAKK